MFELQLMLIENIPSNNPPYQLANLYDILMYYIYIYPNAWTFGHALDYFPNAFAQDLVDEINEREEAKRAAKDTGRL